MVLWVAVFLLVGAAAFGVLGQYLVAAQRARSAADLAALAGAQAYGSGKDGCAAAEQYAARNDHRLAGCSIVGEKIDFVLTTKIIAPVPVQSPVLPKSITVRANAGPVR
jgi:secretion/DNA translocation related TadE-like protein